MALRPFKLPTDIDIMLDLIPRTFNYPENPEWNVQDDEMESMIDSMRGARRLWPVIRLVQLVAPPMRDIMRGYVWEEDDQPVGLTNVLRQGATDLWYIGNVSVLPEYRRRGIARKLVQASVDYARERKAKSITLDVVAGNLPAYTLYENLGFETYSGTAQMAREMDAPLPPEIALPDGYTVEPLPLGSWRERYELAQRITPDIVTKFMPVEEGRFRQPAILRVLAPLLFRAMGARPYNFAARRDGQVVAVGGYFARTRKGGINQVSLTLDPAHADLGPALLSKFLRDVTALSPGRRVEMSATGWQQPVIEAALAAGFEKHYESHTMGILM
ncbi:MAG: GNAT family N-acetyltransferase [Anaerolineae bacterium]|nr:GNAT family N-acetyltransferase [Anaerolineae bacterium]